MMKLCLLYLWLIAAVVNAIEYKKDGDLTIGAIVPLTTEASDCKEIDPKGVALAEAIANGFDKIKRNSDFDATSLGYDIRDNCGQAKTTKDHALDMAQKKTDGDKGAVQVVIGAFTTEDTDTISIFKAAGITQVSYSPENARLKKEIDSDYPITDLISIYPSYNKKVSVAVDVVKTFGFDYVYAIASNNVEGTTAMEELSSKLGSANICLDEFLISDKSEVPSIVASVTKNSRIRVVIVHCSEDIELALYKELSAQKKTNLVLITTQNFQADLSPLKEYADVVDGMLDIYDKEDNAAFQSYMREMDLPYTKRPWIQALFEGKGGNKSCLTNGDTPGCIKVSDEVNSLLLENAAASAYANQAVLAVAFALKKAKGGGKTLLECIAGLQIDLPSLAANPLVISSDLAAERSTFAIENYRIVDKALEAKWVGKWNEKNQMGPALSMNKNDVVWQEGSTDVPESVCSATCAAGWSRSFKGDEKCCWKCVRCPNGTASDAPNSDACVTCPANSALKPDQSGCKAYTLLSFEWGGVVGNIIIVLMIIGVVLVLFGLAVFSKYSTHELVVNANWNSLSVFCIALLILIFAPIPLLLETPFEGACFAYTILFNLGISIVLGIMISRSAAINGLFDGDGEVSRGCLGPFPRTICVLLTVALQLIVTLVAYRLENLRALHNETDQWDVRYNECATWASATFWAGFTFNILASVVGNSMSCSSIQMEDNCWELKYVLLTHLMFYLFGIVELVIFFRCNDQYLAGGQAVNCILFALIFYFTYAWPKIYTILFQSKGDKVLQVDEEEDEQRRRSFAMSGADGFKNRGIVQMEIREA